MSQYDEIRQDLANAYEVLKNGGLILYPTDTIWGIGCDATNEESVERIFRLKERVDSKAMLVLIEAEQRLNYYVKEVPEIAWDLIDVADKPLTIIYPGARNLAGNLIAADGTIGIRITREKFSSALIRKFGKAIVSTSANITGKTPPSSFREIDPVIMEGVDYIVEYRQDDLQRFSPSGIIRIGVKGEVEVIRQ